MLIGLTDKQEANDVLPILFTTMPIFINEPGRILQKCITHELRHCIDWILHHQVVCLADLVDIQLRVACQQNEGGFRKTLHAALQVAINRCRQTRKATGIKRIKI